MKKLFSMLLVCTFAFSTVTFVGCGKKEEPAAPAAGGAEGGEAEGGEAEGGEAEGGEAEGGEEEATE